MYVTKDMYGFSTVPLTEDEQVARQASSLQARKLVKAWQAVTPHTNLSGGQLRQQALKALIRKGIPFEHRPAMWFCLSGADEKRSMFPSDYYQNASCTNFGSTGLQFAIEEDVRSIYRQHVLFQSLDGLSALRRLLLAFFQHANEGGYFRGLVNVASFVLIIMGLEKEEEAFWVLVALLEGKLVPTSTSQAAYASKVEQQVLERLVQKKMPKLHHHLSKVDGGFPAVTASWFSNAFTTALPAETTVRVWDAMILEGPKVLLRVGLALLKRYESSLLSCSFSEHVSGILETRCIRTYDTEGLLQMAFRGIGSMPNTAISSLREQACKDVAVRVEHLYARLSGVINPVPASTG